MPERTLPRLFEESVKAYPGNVLIWEKAGERYAPTSYAQMRDLVHAFAAGLMSLGLRRGDRAALISEGRRDWIVSELGGRRVVRLVANGNRRSVFTGVPGGLMAPQFLAADTAGAVYVTDAATSRVRKFDPDGAWLLFGSTRSGTRQLYVSRADGTGAYPVTNVAAGCGAMWPHWQPRG